MADRVQAGELEVTTILLPDKDARARFRAMVIHELHQASAELHRTTSHGETNARADSCFRRIEFCRDLIGQIGWNGNQYASRNRSRQEHA